MCAVTMQSFARKSGLFGEGGSLEGTRAHRPSVHFLLDRLHPFTFGP
jgi:hypothetical protein